MPVRGWCGSCWAYCVTSARSSGEASPAFVSYETTCLMLNTECVCTRSPVVTLARPSPSGPNRRSSPRYLSPTWSHILRLIMLPEPGCCSPRLFLHPPDCLMARFWTPGTRWSGGQVQISLPRLCELKWALYNLACNLVENGEICKPFFVFVLFSLHLLDANSVPPFNKKTCSPAVYCGLFWKQNKEGEEQHCTQG